MSTGTVVTLEQFALGLLLVGCLVRTVRCNVARFVANVACARLVLGAELVLVSGALELRAFLGCACPRLGWRVPF